MTLETNDEAVDVSRRSMMNRLGLVASVAIAAPVLMTMSTSALAHHVKKSQDGYNPTAAAKSNAGGKKSGEWKDDDDEEGGGSTCPEGGFCL